VGDHNHGATLFGNREHDSSTSPTSSGVQGQRRLINQHDLEIDGQGPVDGNPLVLNLLKKGRKYVLAVVVTDPLKVGIGPLRCMRLLPGHTTCRPTDDDNSQRYVLCIQAEGALIDSEWRVLVRCDNGVGSHGHVVDSSHHQANRYKTGVPWAITHAVGESVSAEIVAFCQVAERSIGFQSQAAGKWTGFESLQ